MANKNSTDEINLRTPETIKRSTHVILIDSDDGNGSFSTKGMQFAVLFRKTIKAFLSTVAVSGYTQLESEEIITVDATLAASIITLLSAANRTGQQIIIKKIDVSANTVTIDPSGAETIDGAATNVLSSQYDSITLVSDGTNWIIVA